MSRRMLSTGALIAATALVLCAAPVLAEKPSRSAASDTVQASPSRPPQGQPPPGARGYRAGPPPGAPPARPPGPPPRPPGPPPRPPRDGHDYRARHYPPPGHFVPALPRGSSVAHHHHARYYYGGGVWYRPHGLYYRVVVPPVGLVVSFLPSYYTTFWYGGVPFYYANSVYYVRRSDGPGYVVTEPPGPFADAAEPATAFAGEEFFVYPGRGQSEETQARDRYECHRWAVEQTGFDPSQPQGGVPESQNAAARDDYRRAISACLEARDYTVR